jgi:hypothetical protein
MGGVGGDSKGMLPVSVRLADGRGEGGGEAGWGI